MSEVDTSESVTDSGLTLRESRFVDAYMENGGNGTAAAMTAGYAPHSPNAGQRRKSCGCWASKMLSKRLVRDEIDRRANADPLVKSRAERLRWLSKKMDSFEGEREQLNACRTLCQCCGDMVEARFKERQKGSGLKPASEWTDDELLALLEKKRREAGPPAVVSEVSGG